MLNFNFTYAPGTTLQQMVGMEMAGRIWSSYLKDPVTLNIHVGVVSRSSLPTNVIGGALPGIQAAQQITTIRNQLSTEAGTLGYWNALGSNYDGRSFDDKMAMQYFWDDSLSAWIDYKWAGANDTALLNTSTLNVNRANAKAMGMTLSNTNDLDGYILFSDLAGATTSSGQSINWSYNYTGTPGSNQLDFLTTAVHEIGHILGFVSGVDRPGWLANSFADGQYSTFLENANQQVRNATPLDMFRFSGSYDREISYGTINSEDTERYFSIDRGQTKIADFSTGSDILRGGDGSQASHWKQGVTSVMAPKLRVGSRQSVGAIDLRAMDVIGWDLKTTSAGDAATNLADETRMLQRGANNAASLASTTLNFSTLQSAAISSLASRVGQTTSWITSNLTNVSVVLPSSLRSNRDAAVGTMIQNSQVYNYGGDGDGWWYGGDGDGWWQKMLNLFRSESLFSTIDELEFAPTDQSGLATDAVLEAVTSDVLSVFGDAQLTPAMFLTIPAIQTITSRLQSRSSQPETSNSEGNLVAAMEAFSVMTVNPTNSSQQFGWLERWDREWPLSKPSGDTANQTSASSQPQDLLLSDLFV